MYPANTEALKEPRGFIKFLEIVIAIFAFATTTSHHSESEFAVHCPEPVGTKPVALPFSYSYKLDNACFDTPVCTSTNATKSSICVFGNYSSAAEFYVFVGVMAFLYALAALVFYVFCDEQYQHNDKVPIADFIITIVFAALWLISSSAWADALTKIKHYTDPADVIFDKERNPFPECQGGFGPNVTCTVTSQGNFASLNVSIIFGFLNMLIWTGNLWFLYKETKWFKPAEDKTSPDYLSPETPPQRM
jgi:hypothetical protein